MQRQYLWLLVGLSLFCGFVLVRIVVSTRPTEPSLPAPQSTTTPAPEVVPVVENSPLKDVEGGWVLRGWAGYMGVAICFKRGGTFDYWFYSDVKSGNEPKYPVTGTWKWNGDVLELVSEHRLHDTRWHVYHHKGKVTLLPAYAQEWQVKDGKTREDRLLFRVPDFDPKQPFASQRFERRGEP
jgi:hypothetical protein